MSNKVEIAVLGVDQSGPAKKGLQDIKTELAGVGKQAEETSHKTTSATGQMATSYAGMAKAALAAAAAIAAWKLTEYIAEAAKYAARIETIAVAMHAVGNNSGYTAAQMDIYEQQVKKMGITTEAARQALTQTASAQMDVAKTAQLARVAQDAAVIGNINSSEALMRMVQGIRSGETEILKTIGINVSFENSYKKMADSLGITTAALSEQQKVQARQNSVLEYGVNISGVYEAAMGTTGKALTSLARYYDELKLAFGKAFAPALGVLIDNTTEKLKELLNWVTDNKSAIAEFAQNIASITSGVMNAVIHPIDTLGKILIAPFVGGEDDIATANEQAAVAKKYDEMMAKKAEADRMRKMAAAKAIVESAATASATAKATAEADKKATAAYAQEVSDRYQLSVAEQATAAKALEAAKQAGYKETSDIYQLVQQDRINADKAVAEAAKAAAEATSAKNQEISDEYQMIVRDMEKVAAANKLAFDTSAIGGMLNALKRYSEESADIGFQMENAVLNAFDNMEDALVNFVTTGKLSFKSLVDSIVADVARMAVKQAVTGPMADILRGVFSGSAPLKAANVPSINATGTAGAGAGSAIPVIGMVVAVYSVYQAMVDSDKARKKEAADALKMLETLNTSVLVKSQSLTGNVNQAQMTSLTAEQKKTQDAFVDALDRAMLANGDTVKEMLSGKYNQYGFNVTEQKDVSDYFTGSMSSFNAYKSETTSAERATELSAQWNNLLEVQRLEVAALLQKQNLGKTNLLMQELELKGLKDSEPYRQLLIIQRAVESRELDKSIDMYGRSAYSIQQDTYALQDRIAAEEKAKTLQATNDNLSVTLLELQGKSFEALMLSRQIETAGMDKTTLAIKHKIYALQDEKAAAEAATAATIAAVAALKSGLVNTALSAAQALKAIMGPGALTTASPEKLYTDQKAAFADALANNRTTELPALGQALLTASRAYNASGAGYTTDYNSVTRALEQLAFGKVVDIPALTLTAIEKQIQLLTDIGANTALTASATTTLQQLMAQQTAQTVLEMAVGLRTPNLAYDTNADSAITLADAMAYLRQANGLPAFAAGTNYLPYDMTARVHEGERIIPKADNYELMRRLDQPSADNKELIAEIRALRAEVAELKGHSAAGVRVAQAGFSKVIEQGAEANKNGATMAQKVKLQAAA